MHAARNAAEHGVALPLRLAAGLEAVRPEECDTVSIAGHGRPDDCRYPGGRAVDGDGEHLLSFTANDDGL